MHLKIKNQISHHVWDETDYFFVSELLKLNIPKHIWCHCLKITRHKIRLNVKLAEDGIKRILFDRTYNQNEIAD